VNVGILVRESDGATVATNARARHLLSGDGSDPGVTLSSVTVPGPPGNGDLVVTTLLEAAPAPDERPPDPDRRRLDSHIHTVVEHSPVGFALLEPHGRILETNPALGRILSRDPADLPGHSLWEFVHPDDPGLDAELRDALHQGYRDSYTMERRYLRPDGRTVWARTTFTAVREETGPHEPPGPPLHLVAQLQDITDIRLAQEALHHQVLHDPLTGLANRTLGLDRIRQALDRTARSHRRVAVLSCELDRFAVVNDSIGHQHGDTVLIEVARRLQRVLRSSDTAARIGGDEFLIVCEDIQDDREAVLVADRILAAVREPIDVDDHRVVQTMSIGIAVSSTRGTDPLSLLRDAGAAAHRAKQSGLGGWDIVDDDLRRQAVERLDIEQALRAGLRNGDLRLFFQPIVEVASGRPVGREALIRWQHPERGLLAPLSFLPVAETTGLIEDIGRWVLLEAARTAAATPEHGYIAVNVSPSQVTRAGLLADVENVLDTTSLPPDQLVIELTESVMLGAAPAGRAELQRLDDLGVRLVVDDFGTGFSALSYLRDLPVSGIKVDRSFTSGLGRDAQCDRIVEALTGLAHGLGVDLVAEGVETEQQRHQLTEFGCRHAQGYLFGKPAPHIERTITLA
jgi:diguanylate cyclase (GGDEF)-like protein/PAS domain S-box-containing protein